MKRVCQMLMVAAGCILFSVVYADEVETQGEWGGVKIKTTTPSVAPVPPTASVEGRDLSIYFEEAIPNLVVTVTHANGMIAYQSSVSGGSGYTLIIPLSPGNYQLALGHRKYGLLQGTFIVE